MHAGAGSRGSFGHFGGGRIGGFGEFEHGFGGFRHVGSPFERLPAGDLWPISFNNPLYQDTIIDYDTITVPQDLPLYMVGRQLVRIGEAYNQKISLNSLIFEKCLRY